MRYGTWKGLPRYSGGVRKWDYGRAVRIRAVFIHIMEGNLSGTDAWFRNPASGTVSTHFGIGFASWTDRLLGRVSTYQWVDTNNTAYGTAVTRNPVSALAQKVLGDLIGRIDINHAIIHIEVEGYPTKSWHPGFVRALNNLLAALAYHGPLYVMRHNDVSSKVCPGAATPWGSIRPTYGQRLGTTTTLPDTSTPTAALRADYGAPNMRFRARNMQMTLKAGKPIRNGASINAATVARTPSEQSVHVIGEMKPTGSYDPWYIYAYYLGNGHAFCYSPRIDFK